MKTSVYKILQNGGIVLMPTDTVYGICARAEDPLAVAKLYELKKRKAKPGTVIAGSIDQLVELGLKRRYLTAVEYFWPGAVSVVVPSEPKLKYIDQGTGTIAVRITSDKKFKKILDKTGPLLTSSANNPGEPTVSTASKGKAIFKNKIDAYVDGGNISGREPSTVIRVVDDMVEVLRQGAVKISESGKIEK